MKLEANRRANRRAAFTLLEIMLVVTIIALLIGTATYYFSGNLVVAKDVRAKEELQVIATQLNTYMAGNGSYPTTTQGLKALVSPPVTDPKPQQWHQLLESEAKLTDPWGHPYIYVIPGKHNVDSFDLYSAGPDGIPNTNDDIVNWDTTSPNSDNPVKFLSLVPKLHLGTHLSWKLSFPPRPHCSSASSAPLRLCVKISALLATNTLLAAAPPDILPHSLPPGRYNALAAKSLFSPAAPVAAIQPKPSFAANLFVVGLAQFDNKDFVMIINRRTHEKFSLLTGGEKGPDDVELASVRWAADPSQSAVTVKRGPDASVLEFDESAFQKPPVQPQVLTAGPRPGMPFRPPLPIPSRHIFPLATSSRAVAGV